MPKNGIIQISVGTKFQLKMTVLIFLDQISSKTSKTVFPINKRTSELQHGMLHIRISLGTTFQRKQTILIFFFTKFAQKGYFQSKTKKVKTTMVFWLFDLV